MSSRRFLRHAALLLPLLAACVPHAGPRTVPRARFDYNQAVVRSWNEQLLLNLVRLRYRDTPLFLEVDSILAQYHVSGETSGSVDLVPGADLFGLRGGVAVSESPVITYTPLRGEVFAKRLLIPMSPTTLVLLANSGWSIERLMLCCVRRLGTLDNAPRAAGPTPDTPPRYEAFHELADKLRALQKVGRLQVSAPADDVVALALDEQGLDGELAAARARVGELLGVGEGWVRLHLVSEPAFRPGEGQPPEVLIIGRSLLGTLFFLSQSVTPPVGHEAWVTITEDVASLGPAREACRLAGRERPVSGFDWAWVTGRLMCIHSSPLPPQEAFVRIFYRQHWFWIADADTNSKSTFILLSYLFSLQAVESGGRSPLVTVSGGG